MNIKRIIYCIIAVLLVSLITLVTCLGVSNARLQKQVEHQDAIIDSLLARRMKVMDVDLYVTDKSVNKVYGRYNKGQITMPSIKTYTLDIDSVSIR